MSLQQLAKNCSPLIFFQNFIILWLTENGENMLIVHSLANESYEPHHDYYHDESKLAVGGHRVATVLMYLSNVSRGGETIFPQSKVRLELYAIFLFYFSE